MVSRLVAASVGFCALSSLSTSLGLVSLASSRHFCRPHYYCRCFQRRLVVVVVVGGGVAVVSE